jgi:diguanylate cyclase (GGDEF)-like protein
VAELLQVTRLRKFGNIETHSKDGINVVTAFDHSNVWGWTVVTGAPQAQLDADLTRTTSITVLLLGLGIGIGSLLAYFLARQVLTSVKSLNDAAIAMRNGQRVELPVVQLKEAQAVGAAIIEASLHLEDVHHRATHDALTRLGNRDFFYAIGTHQIAEAQRASRPLAVLVLDLDHFKQVNDTEGHAKGDAVLIEVSSRINGIIRASDLAARFGGDEFCVMLVDADQATATSIAGRLVAEISRAYRDVRTQVSASVGIAIYPEAADTLASLIAAADGALYKVKNSGRNGFAVAPHHVHA